MFVEATESKLKIMVEINIENLINNELLNKILDVELTWRELSGEAINNDELECSGIYLIKEGEEISPEKISDIISNEIKLIYIGHGGRETIKGRLKKHLDNSIGKRLNHITNNWYKYLTGNNPSKTPKTPQEDRRKAIEKSNKKNLYFTYIKTNCSYSSLILETILLKELEPTECNYYPSKVN